MRACMDSDCRRDDLDLDSDFSREAMYHLLSLLFLRLVRDAVFQLPFHRYIYICIDENH